MIKSEELSDVRASINELARWRNNREAKARERAAQGGYKKPMTCDALEEAIRLLKRYEKVIQLIKE